MKVELKLNGKTVAAATLVFLGIVLAMATTIARGTGAGPVNAPALVQTIVKEEDHVTPGQLAQWLIEKRTDFQLIDIREPWQFDDYHIPTAVNIPLTGLFEDAGLKKLAREKKIVVYGLGGTRAAQAQLLLSLKGYNAFSVPDGITAWWNDIITPTSLRSEDQTPAGYLQAKQLREHFLGSAPTGETTAAPPPATPTLPPAQSMPTGPTLGKKLKLGRGCS
jgi:rhodanese-related sulfurtransferase